MFTGIGIASGLRGGEGLTVTSEQVSRKKETSQARAAERQASGSSRGVRSQQSTCRRVPAAAVSAYQQQMQGQAQAKLKLKLKLKRRPSRTPISTSSIRSSSRQSARLPPNRSGGYRSTTAARPGAQKPSLPGAKMGIKSGMTVEDLKRLTQKRMQQTANSNPATPKASAPEGFLVREAIHAQDQHGSGQRHLHTRSSGHSAGRSQDWHVSSGAQATHSATRGVSERPTHSHRGTLPSAPTTPEAVAARSSAVRSTVAFGNDLSRSHGPSDLSRSHGPLSSGSSGDVIPETDPGRGSVDDGAIPSRNSLLQFQEDSFPPPPPMDESGGLYPQHYRRGLRPCQEQEAQRLSEQCATFYNQQTSYYNIASKDERPLLLELAQATRRTKMHRQPAVGSIQAHRLLLRLLRECCQVRRPLLAVMPLSGGANAARRGSFGNAAEFFKFRRRSKSRLELARDMSFGDNGELAGYPSYGTAGAMPGIAERHGDAEDEIHEDSASEASASTSANDESSSQDYTDEDVVQVTGGYDDTAEISGSFVSFYNAARQQQSGLSTLAIPPPPPPPPMADDDDDASTTSSTKGNGLPMMSPNGARLRKVAELARRGSLSSEDKTRAKDEIIQSSLGIGASNAARLLATRMKIGETVCQPQPRSTKKMLAPGSGIVRSSTAAPSSGATSQKVGTGSNSSLEERLAAAAQRVAECVGKGDMTGFQQAMDELDWLRNEASNLMRG
ncbi:hypothetical protein GQ600_1315 [Phytophthora cactorum]|nr:hypothetical protein GQ600_1315 [Phytophthora cactorum]